MVGAEGQHFTSEECRLVSANCLLQEAVGIPEHGSRGGRKFEGSFQKLEHCVMIWYSQVRSKKMAWHLWGVAVERG